MFFSADPVCFSRDTLTNKYHHETSLTVRQLYFVFRNAMFKYANEGDGDEKAKLWENATAAILSSSNEMCFNTKATRSVPSKINTRRRWKKNLNYSKLPWAKKKK